MINKKQEDCEKLIITYFFIQKIRRTKNMSKTRSPQEIRIKNEIKHKQESNIHQNRATKILKKVRGLKPQIDVERGLYFTKSFQQTEGQPLVLRWAKALKYYAENATVYIDEDQLIVGRSGKQGRYGILYPELDGDTLGEAIKTLPQRNVSPFDITPEDAKIITSDAIILWAERHAWKHYDHCSGWEDHTDR